MTAFENTADKVELNLLDNKATGIKAITGIEISRFRSLETQSLKLGSNITILSGRNGTMKTSLMGLIAHPFNSDSTDAFGKTLKTTLKEVFKFSPQYDNNKYEYDLIIDTGHASLLRAPVSIYYVADKTNRHRVVVSGAEKGDGNFTYNTSFLNLKRLYPLVDTTASPDLNNTIELTAQEAIQLKDYYETVFPSSEYSAFAPIHQKNIKTTFAPTGDGAKYDWNAISSGEDNLGSIFNKLIGFQRSYTADSVNGNGVFCIDEFESSLHPVAQLRLFDYLYRWSQRYKVQIIISTHSLHLISHVYLQHTDNLKAARIVFNFISKSTAKNNNFPILHNPPYELAYKELTFQDPAKVAEARKVKIFCEDEFAVHFAKKLIKKSSVLNAVEFHSSLDPGAVRPGTPYTGLRALCIQFPLLLERSFVLFDADVKNELINSISNKDLYLRLPDHESLAIERRIMVYISELNNDDNFFTLFNKEREIFLDSFKRSGAKSLNPDDLKNEQKTSIEVCKRWADTHRAEFKKYVTHYSNHCPGRELFTQSFIALINRINSRQGIPEIG